jgi:hypothetical protein
MHHFLHVKLWEFQLCPKGPGSRFPAWQAFKIQLFFPEYYTREISMFLAFVAGGQKNLPLKKSKLPRL